MRATIELSDRTYRRLREAAASRGLRGVSRLVEEAVDRYLEQTEERGGQMPALADVEGAWSEEDVREWESARAQAWATWPTRLQS